MAYLYLIEEIPLEGENSGPWCKIGISKNPPEWRLNANLKRGNPRDLVVRYCYELQDIQSVRLSEKKAHHYFKEHLRTKEWFNISADIANNWLIEELKLIPRAQPT
jgi:hypothetical protein